ncbi:MAG: DUF11 domain-containing protein [Candidatus Vogelbacteria bacterium]|nr:DUF11 domain-containing protein [Candidatus Vogelbacteria bacterium]
MKIDKIFNKRAIALFTFLFSIILPLQASAYAAMNTDPQDYPTVAVVNVRTNPVPSQTVWSTSETARPGDPMNVRIYFHTDNASTEPARQVRARIQMPTGNSTQFTISGSVGGTNTNLSTGQSTITLNPAEQQHIIIRPNSVKWFPTQASIQANQPAPFPNGQTGDEIFTSGGVLLGDVPGGWPNQGAIVADFWISNDAPVAPVVTTNPATNVTVSSATLNGNVTTNGAPGMTAWFDWGTDQNNLSNRTQVISTSGGVYSANLNGLSSNTTYYFRASGKASDSVQIFSGATLNFTTGNNPASVCPAVTTSPATSVTQTSATIGGSITGTSGSTVTRWFDLGNSPSNLGQFTQEIPANVDGSVSQNLFNLQPNQIYYYRLVARTSNLSCPGAVNGIILGNALNFTTGAQAQGISATTNPATSVTQASATLNGATTLNGNTNVTRWFEWGPTQGLGVLTAPQNASDSNYQDAIGNLSPNTTYYFQAVARTQTGQVARGVILPFATQGTVNSCPTITTLSATNLTINGATLNATVSGITGIGPGMWFEYGPTTSYGYTTTIQAPQNGQNQAFAGNLTPGQTYFFRAILQAPNCAVTNGGQMSFTLGQQAQNLSVTTQSATNVTVSSATLNGYLTASNYSNVTRWFEWGTNSSYGNRTNTQSAYSAGNFSDYISGLSQNTTYFFRAVAQDGNGNVAYGSQLNFTTPSSGGSANFYSCPNYTIGTLTASPIDSTSAYLRGVVNSNSSSGYSYTTWIEYGPTTSYGMSTTRQYNSGGTFTQLVANLQPGVIYYYRAVAQVENNGYSGGYFNSFFCGYQNIQYGNSLTVSTQSQTFVPYVQPVIQPQPVIIQQQITQSVITQPATSITQTAARVNGVATISNVPTNGWFEWGTSVNLGSQTNPADLGNYSSNTFYANLNSLQPGQTYYFRAVIQNKQNGNTLKGDVLSFRTLTPVYVPPVYDYTPPVKPSTAPVKLTIAKEAQNISSPNGGIGCSDAVTAKAGNTIAYYITVKNSGGVEANGVLVKDVMPDFLRFRAGSDNARYDESSREVSWNIDLRAGETKQLQVQALVDRVTENKTVKNTASITYGSTVKRSGTPCLIIMVDPVTLVLSPDKNSVNAGDTLTYTVIYRNSSGAKISSAVLRVLLPADTTLISAEKGTISSSDGTIVLTVGDMQPKEEGRFRITVKIGNTAAAGSTLTAVLVMDYRDAVGQEQAEAHSFVPVLIGGSAATQILDSSMEKQGTGLGALFGTGFLPQTLIGWLVLIVILLALYFIGRKILNPNAGVSKTDVIVK